MRAARLALVVACVLALGVPPVEAAATTTTTPRRAAASTTTTTARKRPASTTTTTAGKKAPGPAKKKPATPTTTSPEAARQAEITDELRSLREQVEEASAEEAKVLGVLDEVAESRRDVEEQLRAIEAELATATAEVEAADARLSAVAGDLQRAETKYVATEGDLSGARVALADRAVRAYMHQPSAQLATVVLDRSSFRELAAARDFLRTFAELQARSVERYQDLQAAIDAERAQLSGSRDAAAAQREVVAFHRAQLVRVRERQRSLRARAASEEERHRAVLGDVRGRVKDFEAEIASLKKESDAIGALLRARQKAQAPAKPAVARAVPSGGGLGAPVPGAITSTFGPRRHPIFGTMRMHTGVDFAATSGTPVRAAADGTVVAAGDRGGYGTTVILDHGNGLATLSAHLSRAAVAEGASVARGTVVGYAGSTGYSTGPHLHFEVRIDGNPVDPVRHL